MPTLPAHLPARAAASARLARLPLQALAGSLVLALAAHVAVPFWPVPLTLQTLAVLGLGVVLGPVAAALAVLAWMAEGAAGLPVFAAGPGLATLLGPTGGYIVGFLPAACLAGAAARSGRFGATLVTAAACAATLLAADAVVFAFGVAWLAHLVGWSKAVDGGLTPFLLGEALKVGLATAGATLLAGSQARRG